MSHDYQVIVDRDASAAEAEPLSRQAIDWLVDACIIDETPAACVPDSSARGHRPGPAWQSAIVEIDERFLQREVNGVEVRLGRQIFDAGIYEPTPFCPRCDRPHTPGEAWQRALDAWQSGDDKAALTCPRCGAPSPLVDWRHDPPIGFGHLGIVFWNWPSLNREFIERLARYLGDRLVLVEGALEA